MNLKRFTARTSREALALVKQTFGEDAVVMSTKPCPEGIEVLAMAPESLSQLERVDAPRVAQPRPEPAAPTGGLMSTRFMRRLTQREQAPAAAPPAAAQAPQRMAPRAEPRHEARTEPRFDSHATSVDQDVEQMAMSTLSFQDYVRERMLKRRQLELEAAEPAPAAAQSPSRVTPLRARTQAQAAPAAAARAPVPSLATPAAAPAPRPVPVLREEIRVAAPTPTHALPRLADTPTRREQDDTMMNELRSMRGLIEQRFGALAFMEKLQRQPRHAQLTQKLLEAGFSPTLVRRLAESLSEQGEPMAWAATVLERNLATGEPIPALEDVGGVYALIGTTGVGKTTSTAKLAAAFAAKHGAANLGLITLDAYRIGGHEQLRQYGRILGVPVHVAHDRASLEDLLELLGAKKLILIDTAGMAQRDVRTRELLDMLSHPAIRRLLVLNAAAQGETFEDVVAAYGAAACHGAVLSKIDEAVKLGPALDVLIRHKLRVMAVANGQRVPEDWHRLSAQALVQRALRSQAAPAWRFDSGDVNLVFAGVNHPQPRAASASRAVHA